MDKQIKSVEELMRNAIEKELQPIVINVVNQSAKHQGHSGDDGSGESHFDLYIVSNLLQGHSKIERHRMIFSILQKHLETLPHALSIKALAPDEV